MKQTIKSIALTLIALLLIGCASREDAVASNPTTNATNNISDAVEQVLSPTAEPSPTRIPPTNTPTRVPTSTPKPTFTPLPTALPTRLPTLTPTPTAVPPTATPNPTATPDPSPTVEVSLSDDPHAVIGVTLDDVLNVRAAPDPAADIVTTLNPTAQDIAVSTDRRAVGNSEWVQIRANGVDGWVNAAYLARQMGQADAVVANRALSALIALRDKDMAAFATLVHPVEGVIFAPLTTLEPSNLVFSAETVPSLFNDSTIYQWGFSAGEGSEINATFAEYYFEFIYPYDYLFADTIGYNTNIITGNMIDNSRDLDPAAQIVEYHFDGFYPDYGGLDYRTLRIVLTEYEGEWVVTAVVNNAWTP